MEPEPDQEFVDTDEEVDSQFDENDFPYELGVLHMPQDPARDLDNNDETKDADPRQRLIATAKHTYCIQTIMPSFYLSKWRPDPYARMQIGLSTHTECGQYVLRLIQQLAMACQKTESIRMSQRSFYGRQNEDLKEEYKRALAQGTRIQNELLWFIDPYWTTDQAGRYDEEFKAALHAEEFLNDKVERLRSEWKWLDRLAHSHVEWAPAPFERHVWFDRWALMWRVNLDLTQVHFENSGPTLHLPE